MAEQFSRIGPRTMLARFQREGPQKRRPNEPPWATEEIIFSGAGEPFGIRPSRLIRESVLQSHQKSVAGPKTKTYQIGTPRMGETKQ